MPDPDQVRAMFAKVAPGYDRANRMLSLGIDRSWRRRLVKAVGSRRPRRVLDLATGSGDVAFELAAGLPEGTGVAGMDFCPEMLEVAESRRESAADARMSRVEFSVGDGLAVPAGEASYDAVTIAFGLRNMADRHHALREMFRVLRPGGQLCVLEFSQPWAWVRPFYFLYLGRIAPWIAGRITGQPSAYHYLCDSIRSFPGHEALAGEIRAAGFGSVEVTRLTFGTVALHVALKD